MSFLTHFTNVKFIDLSLHLIAYHLNLLPLQSPLYVLHDFILVDDVILEFPFMVNH